MRYIALKQELCNNIKDLNNDDFFLLEGKLIFKNASAGNLVKEYLNNKLGNEAKVYTQKPRNWPHWDKQYEMELWFSNLPKI